jgi:uncharacterized membrane protein
VELPAHVEETIKTIAGFHAQHHREATRMERFVERTVGFASRPQFLALLTLAVILWIVANVALAAAGLPPADPPPFFALQGVVGLAALMMTVLILITQNREKKIGEHRDQLTLELAILSEKKAAKLIALIEEMRRDSPHLADRVDQAAAELSVPADPGTILQAIKESHEEAVAMTEAVREETD